MGLRRAAGWAKVHGFERRSPGDSVVMIVEGLCMTSLQIGQSPASVKRSELSLLDTSWSSSTAWLSCFCARGGNPACARLR